MKKPVIKGTNHVFQGGLRINIARELARTSIDLMGHDFPAPGDHLIDLPVTCDGKVVGTVKTVIMDELQIEIHEEHRDFVAAKLKENRWTFPASVGSKDSTPTSPGTPSTP